MEYFEAVRAAGRPTDAHFDRFARHLAQDHSWYKHLPAVDPGEPFVVYPSPNTQMAVIGQVGGGESLRRFVRRQGRFPFPTMAIEYQPGDIEPDGVPPLDYLTGGVTTDDYRSRFGIMTYWNHGRPGQPREEAIGSAVGRIRWRDASCEEHPVPREVLELGLVYLTAAIHPFSSRDGVHLDTQRHEQHLALVEAQRNITSLIFD